MLVYALQIANINFYDMELHGYMATDPLMVFFLSHTHAPSLDFLSSLSTAHTLLLTLVSPSQANCHWNQDRFMFSFWNRARRKGGGCCRRRDKRRRGEGWLVIALAWVFAFSPLQNTALHFFFFFLRVPFDLGHSQPWTKR